MGVRLAAAGTILLLTALATGCQLFDDINADAYRQWHDACWLATVEAYVTDRPELVLPAEPPMPRVCAETVAPAYGAIITAAEEERRARRSLHLQSATALQFVAEMLDVLVGRDTLSIEQLAPQIDTYVEEHEVLREHWQERREQVAAAVLALEQAWTEVWPRQDLSFDLAGDAALLEARLIVPPNDVRTIALRQYHGNEYARLAMVYLDYEPATIPSPESHVPEGCDELARALERLEAALLVRYSMDQAIETDVERVAELARVDLSRTPWDEIRIPKGRYARPRVTASIARLRLLKYLDTLLMDCLDIAVFEVDLAWREVWPEHDLETNVFAFAGLTELHAWPSDPLADMTFRQ